MQGEKKTRKYDILLTTCEQGAHSSPFPLHISLQKTLSSLEIFCQQQPKGLCSPTC